MRLCPYCADSIQDAAIFCKHCRRDVAPLAQQSPPPTASAPRATDQVPSAHSGAALPDAAAKVPAQRRVPSSGSKQVVLLLLLFGALGLVMYRREQGAGRGGLVSLFTPPRVIILGGTQDIDVPAGKIQAWEWTAEPNQPSCRVAGHVQVTDGGNRDVRVFVMSRDDYLNMVNGHESRVSFQTEQLTAVDLNVTTTVPGPKVLAISNRFSVFTDKHVQVRGVQVTCQ